MKATIKTLDLDALTMPGMQFVQVEFEDRTNAQVFRIIKALHPEARRIIAIGGSAELLVNLAPHTPIVYVDANRTEMRQVFAKISETLPQALERITFICEEVAESIGRAFSIQPGDAVLFLRSLHHLEDPSGVLAKIKSHLLDGWILIADSSTELMETWQTKKRQARTCTEPQQAWEAMDAQDATCMQGTGAMGLVDESSIRRFLTANNLGSDYLFYNPSCLCGEPFCFEQTLQWFSIHPIP